MSRGHGVTGPRSDIFGSLILMVMVVCTGCGGGGSSSASDDPAATPMTSPDAVLGVVQVMIVGDAFVTEASGLDELGVDQPVDVFGEEGDDGCFDAQTIIADAR